MPHAAPVPLSMPFCRGPGFFQPDCQLQADTARTAIRIRRLPAGFVIPFSGNSFKPPSGPGWVHEIKHDGYRMIVAVVPGPDGSSRFEELSRRRAAQTAICDGAKSPSEPTGDCYEKESDET
jgi:hypothetical protein